jgi:hypothetical protein
MRRVFVIAVFFCWSAMASTVVTADQGKPGNQGPWPVKIVGSSGDGGSTYVTSAPCTGLAQKVTDAGTAVLTVPSVPTANRVWIQICNSQLNSNGASCICQSNGQPTYSAGSPGDTLATGDCATYNITRQDAGVPWCICNGSNISLLSTECVP